MGRQQRARSGFVRRDVLFRFILISMTLLVTMADYHQPEQQANADISNIESSSVEISEKIAELAIIEMNIEEHLEIEDDGMHGLDHDVIGDIDSVSFVEEDRSDLESLADTSLQQQESEQMVEQGEEADKADDAVIKPIALTFDDGPDGRWTLEILDILREYEIKATFFVIGLQVERFPEVLQQIYDEGHVIGNHTYAHENLTDLSRGEIKATIQNNISLIMETIGIEPTLFRAPYGALNDQVRSILAELRQEHTGWTVDTRDWQGIPAEEIIQHVKEGASPGGIILQHCFGSGKIQETVAALPAIIEFLLDEGYTFMTVDQMKAFYNET